MANTYLTRTLGTPTNNYKWTYSFWIKRHSLGNEETVFNAYGGGFSAIKFTSTNALQIYDYRGSTTVMDKVTTRLFRDTSAWYHIVISNDNSISSPETKFYINGVQETSFSTTNEYSQNEANGFNSALPNTIGAFNSGASQICNISLSHVNFIDGTQELPTVFGETDSTTGEWKIKTSPSVTYGNNGFFILKDGNSVTDQSGNSNNFTVAGGTLSKTEDCPSNVFATLNTLDGASMAKNSTFSNGNTTVVVSGTEYTPYGTTIGVSKGKWYAEFKANANMGDGMVGVFANYSGDLALTRYADSYGWYNSSGGNIKTNNANMTGGASVGTYATNDIIQIALDLDNNKLHFNKNNTGWLNSGNPATNAGGYAITDPDSTSLGFYFMSAIDWGGGVRGNWSCNFGNGFFGTTAVTTAGTNASGNGIFEYDVPTGFTALSTKGLNL